MHIFISYPREFEQSAENIYWELLNRGFAYVFLDSETLRAGNKWKVGIEEQIRKADVFIILYDHGAASDKSRYFSTELGHRIKEECKNNEKLIITVIFPPATLKENNLPIYLKARQVIASTSEEIDHPSIDRVIQRVQALEAERREVERRGTESREAERRNERRKYTLVVYLLMAVILILAGIVMVGLERKPPGFYPDNTPTQELEVNKPPDPWARSRETCENLRGVYQLWGRYTLIEEQGIKATSEKGTWEAKSCEQNSASEGTYILNGEEKTEQKVEVEINGKYEYVARAENESRSKVTIDKDGELFDRQINYEFEAPYNGIPRIDHVRKTEQVWKKHEGVILKKLGAYQARLEELHREAVKSMHCTPTRGKKEDDREVIAFTCVIDRSSDDAPKYTRVMVKQNGS